MGCTLCVSEPFKASEQNRGEKHSDRSPRVPHPRDEIIHHRKVIQKHGLATQIENPFSWNVPVQMFEAGLKRPRDGTPLKTDFVSLTDVDGDGVEIGEVVKAVFMVYPGAESMGDDTGGGQLLYPEVSSEDVDQSVVEVELRSDLKIIEQKLNDVRLKVQKHRQDLEADGGRDTQSYIQKTAASLASAAADLGKDVTSANQKSVRLRMAELAKAANALVHDCDDLLTQGDLERTERRRRGNRAWSEII
eukprot:gnl/MRDRNA2_/MRDRNA2_116580_c0_seq1.p1 gnl/MRDRNA2_/MRDRNA2_116580_c0~~gnl/MRDRNA2_/MRDRNA2_116580_c0_seq1.p1  ORF type:complete len:248 (-),score=46.17 gnl/MRDRNA2_/MRDRNA2_116580_c0_seq1:50-793(-)